MSALWSAASIAYATGGAAQGNWSVTSADIDSRTVESGGLFIAMPGTAYDGHKFIDRAAARGAAGYLISDTSALSDNSMPHVLVADVPRALEALGQAARARTTAKIAAITGSVGKTSVKEVTRLALERFRPNFVHASVKSYNNHVGVPLTLARMPEHVKFAVLEMGMNNAGEIAALTAQGKPHVAAITTVASAHLQNFKNEAGIADAKGEIFAGLMPGGTAIIPYDNKHYERLYGYAKNSPAGNIISFSLSDKKADVHIEKIARHSSCSCVTARINDELMTYKINQPGDHWISNSLCVLAIVQAMGGDLGLAGLTLGELAGIDGRGKKIQIPTPDGGTALVFDESYNANPASMAAAFSVLAGYVPRERGRRIAILGDMKELGEKSDQLHLDLAPLIIAADVKVVLVVGPAMTKLAQALPKSIAVELLKSADDALALIKQTIRSDDLLLIKGSNSMGLGKIVTELSKPIISVEIGS
jgi:UDP-N-acetylmuramoyl-tripeptide--D-alanyl-D-alanine ligase